MRLMIAALCALFCSLLSAPAQVAQGIVEGTVFDRIGHKIASASVEAKSSAGLMIKSETDARGVYHLSLPAGTYEVSIVAAGHKSIQQGIVVTPERPLRGLDIVLAIP